MENAGTTDTSDERPAHMQTVALIPAFRPNERLVDLAQQLAAHGIGVVVVDDGSGDAFAATFDAVSAHATVLAHATNQGKGAALKTGLAHIARSIDTPYTIVTADADGQHGIGDVLRVAASASDNPDALVLGVRQLGDGAPLRSRAGNATMAVAFSLAAGTRVSDTQTGLRAFSDRSVAWMRAVGGTRYEYEMAALARWAREGRPLREVNIETIYLDRNRSSHFATVRDSLRVGVALAVTCGGTVARYAGSSLVCFIADYLLFCLLFTLLFATGAPFTAALANVGARIGSAALNFAINRRAVFGSDEPVARSAVRYTLVALVLLASDTVLLQVLVSSGMVFYLAKVLAEGALFPVGYLLQRRLVFGCGATLNTLACDSARQRRATA